MEKTQRQICFDALIDVYKNKGYSTIVLDKHIGKFSNNVNFNSKNFITMIFYGVIERNLTLEYIINKYSKKAVSKLDVEIAIILKMGLYQLIYMDNVPDNAAVNESVNLCKYAKKKSASTIVNAILRAFIRDGSKLEIDEKDATKIYSIKYSCPEWIVKKWIKAYGEENTEKILEKSLGRPPITVRVNNTKTTTQDLLKIFDGLKIQAKACEHIEDCIIIEKTGDIERIEAFKQGLFYVQDLASQFCAKVVGAKPNEIVYDMCSAPGSKSFTIAQYMGNKGEIKAFDLHEHKLKLIEKTATKLGLTSIKALLGDASEFNADLELADKVLCDVPCSGLGIIRRTPEIKYKTYDEISALPQIQFDILQNSSKYVKNEGVLIYSTCALNKQENEDVAYRFLQENKNFEALPIPSYLEDKIIVKKNMATFMPHMMDSDGFFIALFKRSDKIG